MGEIRRSKEDNFWTDQAECIERVTKGNRSLGEYGVINKRLDSVRDGLIISNGNSNDASGNVDRSQGGNVIKSSSYGVDSTRQSRIQNRNKQLKNVREDISLTKIQDHSQIFQSDDSKLAEDYIGHISVIGYNGSPRNLVSNKYSGQQNRSPLFNELKTDPGQQNIELLHTFPINDSNIYPMQLSFVDGLGVGLHNGAGNYSVPSMNLPGSVSQYNVPSPKNSPPYGPLMLSPSSNINQISQHPTRLHAPSVYSNHPNMLISPNPPIPHVQYGFTGYRVGSVGLGWDNQPMVMQYQIPQSPYHLMPVSASGALPFNVPSAPYSHRGFDPSDQSTGDNSKSGFSKKKASESGSKQTANKPVHTVIPQSALPSISDMKGNIKSFSREQLGCRILQQLLAGGDNDVRAIVLQETLDILPDLMIDAFGNYLFQKLFECSDETQRILILTRIEPCLVHSSLNLHGTRSVQRVIEICYQNVSEVNILVKAFSNHTVRMCMDQNGNHVIQKCLLHFAPEQFSFVFQAVTASCLEVCTQRHGCCVVQRCLDAYKNHLNKEQGQGSGSNDNIDSMGFALSSEIVVNAVALMQHQYGNYVVQYVMDMNNGDQVVRICLSAAPLIVPLSLQKFASNVIEKCFKSGSEEVQKVLVEHLIASDMLSQLLDDQFGNYVIQSALEAVPQVLGSRLVDALKPHLIGLRNTSGGRRIMAKLVKNYSTVLFETDIVKLSLEG